MYITDSIRLFYLIFFLLVVAFLTWFVFKVRKSPKKEIKEEPTGRIDKREIAFFSILVTVVIIAHIVTLSNLVPWQKWRIWSDPVPVMQFAIDVEEYQFKLPATPMSVEAGEFVEFTLTSQDVTYGFGVFREDGTLVFQLSVLPGYENQFVWNFSTPGLYDIRSTEYSGAKHSDMWIKDAIEVSGSMEVAYD